MVAKCVLILKTYGLKVAKVVCLLGAAIVNPSASIIADLRAAIEAVTSCSTQRVALVAAAPVTDTYAASDYNDIQDKMLLTFVDADGARMNIKVPGPKTACFVANSDAVNTSDTAVAALITAVKAHAVSRNGAAIVDCLGGRRIRMRNTQSGSVGVAKA